MAASLAIAIAAPIGVKQVLTVKTQRTEKAVEQGTAAETLTTPTLQQPSFEGRSDIKSAPTTMHRRSRPYSWLPRATQTDSSWKISNRTEL